MAVLTFKGGVHPASNKKLTSSRPAEELIPKGDLTFPLFLHHGRHAKPLVKGGEWVSAGTLIAKADGYVSSNVHSSIAGIVKYVDFDSIVIENIGDVNEEPRSIVKPYTELSRKEIIELIREAGIVGMGGEEGYPTHIKLSPEDPGKIKYIIVNGCECEPYISCNNRRLNEEPDKIVEGLKIVLRLFDNAKGVIAIQDDKKAAVIKIKQYLTKDHDIHVKMLYSKYPQGSERQLIYALTKKQVNSHMTPADAGCLVLNVETIYAIRTAVVEGRPLISRMVTVAGDAIKKPGNFKVRLGTNIREVIEAAGGFRKPPEKVIIGGPMTGESLVDLDRPVTKDTNAIIALVHDPVVRVHQTNCIHCGRCIEVCPSRLIPTKLADYSALGMVDLFRDNDGRECIECGSCSYICPAKRSLAEGIVMMKQMIIDEL
ncbi:MAG: electron transport complex subunit RsxC [Lachnospiraceae bacterium]|nr:electron transport complex subunit RsxC [Lachnospiraceae bacterium]